MIEKVSIVIFYMVLIILCFLCFMYISLQDKTVEQFKDIRDNLYYSSNEYDRFYPLFRNPKLTTYNSIDIDQLELLSDLNDSDDQTEKKKSKCYFPAGIVSERKKCPPPNNAIFKKYTEGKNNTKLTTCYFSRHIANNGSNRSNRSNRRNISKCDYNLDDNSLAYQTMYSTYFSNVNNQTKEEEEEEAKKAIGNTCIL